jgi:hypothetical protein
MCSAWILPCQNASTKVFWKHHFLLTLRYKYLFGLYRQSILASLLEEDILVSISYGISCPGNFGDFTKPRCIFHSSDFSALGGNSAPFNHQGPG